MNHPPSIDSTRSLVFISLETWDEVWRRNQFVCKELAKRGWQILFVEPAADWSAGLRYRRWEQFESRPVWSPDELLNVHVVRPVKLFSKLSECGQRGNAWLWWKTVGAAIKRLNWSRPALWVNNQLMWPVADARRRARWGRVLYDITDDWALAGGSPEWLDKVTRDDQAMSRVADAVVVCSQALFDDRKQDLQEKLHLVANGVDATWFLGVDQADIATELKTIKVKAKVVLGYTGTVHPDRLDIPLVLAVARARPEWHWVFVGPSHLGSEDQEKMDSEANVHVLGAKPYAELRSYLAGFDVCVTPHRLTPFTESLNPIKLWEYLAVGKPIVSTPVAGFRDLPDLVHLADASSDDVLEGLMAALDAALSENDELASQRRTLAQDHGWPVRVDTLESLLKEPELKQIEGQ